MSHRFLASIVLAAALCAAASSARADTVTGVVHDPSGAAVAGATVKLSDAQHETVASARTDGRGEFRLGPVTAGSYAIVVSAEGFAEARRVVQVVPGAQASVTVVLDLMPVRDEVTVTSSRGLVQDPRRAVQQVNVVTSEDIRERAPSVVAQAAGDEVGVDLQRTSPSISGIFVRGLTGAKVNVYVDGVRYSTSAMRGGINTFLNLIDPTTLDALEILRGPSGAQYGSDALGGSLQFLSTPPVLGGSGGPTYESRLGLSYASADQSFSSAVGGSYGRPTLGVAVNGVVRRISPLRPGEGIDSHSAFTRFFGLPSDAFIGPTLPDTGLTQYGGFVRAHWMPGAHSQVTATYQRSQQDGGKRYDQLLGGDGNLVADLRNLMLDFGYLRYKVVGAGWLDEVDATYSYNAQREERVNQGGNGNPRAPITHEYERTAVHGAQVNAGKSLGRHTLTFGGDVYWEGIEAPSFGYSPVTDSSAVRRGRVPDGADYRSGGAYAQGTFDVGSRTRLVGNVRWSGAKYSSLASNSPIVNGQPLWPDDSLSVSKPTYRAGAAVSLGRGVTVSGSLSTGYRAPHVTDLGTLGLTGAGFEVAAPDVEGLGATIGTSANATATTTGRPVVQVGSESSTNYEGTIRYDTDRFSTSLTGFVNDIDGNIEKVSLILPQGAVGTLIGGQPVVAQGPTGVVFVAASPSPVLARINGSGARLRGLEYTLDWTALSRLKVSGAWTYIHAEDSETGLPPNIEGGTPAPGGFLKVRFTRADGRAWIEGGVRGAMEQTRLSTLDLEDRRTGATRSRTSIRNFFLNGATARGYVGPGADGLFGSADDVLLATGETVSAIQARVLGTANSAPLYTSLPAYVTFNVRAGLRLGSRHDLFVELENLTDVNYRGISWGLDAPGRGVYVSYRISM
jgi:hemoglobin/transferrin/lactoferrin receptor protein